MAHYVVQIAVEGETLVARATRDFREPVRAAALAVDPGDDVVWLSDAGDLRLRFEESPFASRGQDFAAARGQATPPEIVRSGAFGRMRYTVLLRGGDPAYGATASLVFRCVPREPGAALASIDHGDGEVLARIQGEVRMATHSLELKKGAKGIEYAYELDGTPVADASKAVPYLIVKKYDSVQFWSSDGAVVIALRDGSPFLDGATVLSAAKGETAAKPIKDPVDKQIVGFKYTAVLVNDPADKTKILIDDPHIIIDNTD